MEEFLDECARYGVRVDAKMHGIARLQDLSEKPRDAKSSLSRKVKQPLFWMLSSPVSKGSLGMLLTTYKRGSPTVKTQPFACD